MILVHDGVPEEYNQQDETGHNELDSVGYQERVNQVQGANEREVRLVLVAK